MNYFVHTAGAEAYTAYTDAFMERKYAQVTEEEKALIESFMNDARGESYEPVSRLLAQI